MFEYLGLFLVLIGWIGGLYLVRTWRGTQVMSLSQHAASATKASKFFAAILVVGGSAFYIWLLTWLKPHLGLPNIFTALLTVTFILQVITAIIPDTEAWKRTAHRSAAYIMATLYFPLSLLIISAQATSSLAKVVGVICLGYMLFAAISFFTIKRARNRYLIFQSLYIIAFQLIILSAAYL
ncbi:MAG: hypothetical protein WA843_02330 [Candidatus Saccharimonadales bacterium]